MFPAFLITFREVLEGTLIIATILGILVKLGQTKTIRTVWHATGLAALFGILLLIAGSLFGLRIQELYSGYMEALTEGILMMISAVFITWTLFFLHKYFSGSKTHLFTKIKEKVEKKERRGLFILVFIAVFREGFEISLFLFTVYFASSPQSIYIGFATGLICGVLVSLAFFGATSHLPIRLAFRGVNILLILFAGGFLLRGIHEFGEAGLLPDTWKVTFLLIPQNSSFAGQITQSIFGITKQMNIVQITVYSTYTTFMCWHTFLRRNV